jgi:MFS family permease
MSLAFLDISINALLPLFFHMPIDIGGVGLDPVSIGYIMGFYGAGTGAFQILFFAKLVRRFGIRRVFIMCIATFVPAFLTFPFISLAAKRWGVHMGVWLLVGLLLFMRFFIDTAYGTFENILSRILIDAFSPWLGCIFMYVTDSAPNQRSLGAINGLAQTAVSSARAVGPALSTSLFSFSVQYNILGGYGVYTTLTSLAGLAILLAIQLPRHR